MSEHDPLDALFGDGEASPAQPQATPEAQPATAKPEAEAGQPRDESGRFAPKETQPASAAPALPVEPIVQPAPQKPLTPDDVKGIIDERHKRQEWETRAKSAEERAKAAEDRLLQQNAQPAPSPVDDPDGYTTWQQKQLERAELQNRFRIADRFAIREFGKEIVDAAKAWGMEKASEPNTGQYFAAIYASQEWPTEWIVEQYKREQHWNVAGKDPDAWVRARYAELAAAQGQQPPQPSPAASPQLAAPAAAMPSPSLASARSAGSLVKVAPAGSAFDAAFPK